MDAMNYTTYFWMHDTSQTGGDFTINIYRSSGSVDQQVITIYYSTDQTNWELFGTTAFNSTISKSFPYGSKVYLKATTDYWGKFVGNNAMMHQITANKYHSIGGNIMSLIYGDNFVGKKTFPDDSIKGIFLRLFYGNTYLTDASELVLPVTHSTSPVPTELDNMHNLASCYSRMFFNCTNLVNGPHVDLRSRGEYDLWSCFYLMFSGDTSLSSVHFNTQNGNSRYNNIFANNAMTSNGIFYNYSGTNLQDEYVPSRITEKFINSMYLPTYDRVIDWKTPVNENVDKVTDSNNVTIYEYFQDTTIPFYVQNITNSNETLSIKKSASGAPTLNVQYSRDRVNWTSFGSTSTTAITLTVQPGEKIYLRCDTNSWSNENTISLDYFYYNTITGISKVGGNIMSLIYGSNFTGQETSFKANTAAQFACLFENATTLEQAKDLLLPVTTLNELCYYRLFHGCTSLTTTPKLPANVLAHFCYGYMFTRCTSLTSAPALPATTLANACYEGMFTSCTSLTQAPELHATTLAPYCYSNMFVGCTSLTQAPELPATSLVGYCYYYMFWHCTSLNNIKCLATTGIDVQYSTGYWVENVSSTGTFTKAAGVEWPTGTSGIPEGWTVVEQ